MAYQEVTKTSYGSRLSNFLVAIAVLVYYLISKSKQAEAQAPPAAKAE